MPALTSQQDSFLQDIIQGLGAPGKYLSSKYFYDATGDEIFRQIMHCPEYYLTRCELQIFKDHSDQITTQLLAGHTGFDIIELGAGDASKSVHLLQRVLAQKIDMTYFPIDISTHVIKELESRLPEELPGMKIHGLNGEYLPMLENAITYSRQPKVLLFMGANIGNMTPAEALGFCTTIRSYLSPGDRLLIGFDLLKSPSRILAAYNDAGGYTRDFNLNLLQRINREFEGDFDIPSFEHFPVYDPVSGACKSYLISTREQIVQVAGHRFSFATAEPVYTEISQKYSREQTDAMAEQAGYKSIQHFSDTNGDFLVALWEV